MLLMEELKSLNKVGKPWKIPVIFTDGCTVEALMKKTQNLKSKSYFLSAVTKSDKNLEPTYVPIGKDAFTLAQTILNLIDGPISRESVAAFIAEHKELIVLSNGNAGEYKFNAAGNNMSMNFKMYTYIDGTLGEVKGIQ